MGDGNAISVCILGVKQSWASCSDLVLAVEAEGRKTEDLFCFVFFFV